jgi:hypothetical protein
MAKAHKSEPIPEKISDDPKDVKNDTDIVSEMLSQVGPPTPEVVQKEAAGVSTVENGDVNASAVATASPAASVSPDMSAPEFSPEGLKYPPKSEWYRLDLGDDGRPQLSARGTDWKKKRGKPATKGVNVQASQAAAVAQQINALPNDQLANLFVIIFTSAMVRGFGETFTPMESELNAMKVALTAWLDTIMLNPPPWVVVILAFGAYAAPRFLMDPEAMKKLVKIGNKIRGKKD